MLNAEKNKVLTQVGPGTPMGDYLRRYWMPIGGASEFDAISIKPMRLLGEDLVLYRDRGGRFGLIDRHCPHRRADLAYGFVEETGIRCNYHGWRMDETGRCVEAPYDDIVNPRPGKHRARTKAYPVKEIAGLLFAYMGPEPAPELPIWEPFTWANGFREIVTSEIPCNWFQCQENSCDPVHFEWMHENWNARLSGDESYYAAKHLKLVFEEFDYGFIYKRVREGQRDGDPVWTVGRVTMWPNGFYLGNHFEWRVPIDDENTLSICWFFIRVPKGREPYVQDHVPTWVSPIKDESGHWITSHVINQDIIAWVGQGRVADRSKENLGASDLGIAMMRKRFFDELDAVAHGAEPKGIVRNPNVAKCIELPNITRDTSVEGVAIEDFPKYPLLNARLKGFRHCFGQPADVRRAFERAMGLAET
ncbi:MAG: 5,5-dehydrodivanillate O-demethylase oxygenase subunit [Alphaproteobacteria bacterium]|nr:5,5-dehydrodivanillate O-demethylase oxygenase subunit [Alphaproteobacteria bacterium]